MNILFLTLSPEIIPNNDDGVYNSVLYELSKNNNIYIVSPIQRREKGKTQLFIDKNYFFLKVKTGNITKCNVIEKGISTILIQKQFKHAIKKMFKSVKFDLILYSTPPITFCSVIKYIKKRDNAKTYLMLKDIFPQNAVDLKMFSKKNLIYKYFRMQEIGLYKISDKIGCMSPKNKDFILKDNSFLSEAKVEIFPNSINVIEKNKKNLKLKEYYRKKFNIPADNRVFIYGGNLGKPQDIPFIIECLTKVSKIKGAYFIICGTGTEYDKLQRHYESSKYNNILLLNGFSKAEYNNFLNIGDIGLIFLDYHFTIPNFPSRLLSYMEKSMPVLACTDPNTDVGEIIENNHFGWKCYSNSSDDFVNLVKHILKYNDSQIIKFGNNSFNYLIKEYNSKKNISKIMF